LAVRREGFFSTRESDMNNYSLDEIMEMAFQMEKPGFQFYTGMTGKFKNVEGSVAVHHTDTQGTGT